jgi:hypothetical protein
MLLEVLLWKSVLEGSLERKDYLIHFLVDADIGMCWCGVLCNPLLPMIGTTTYSKKLG